MGQLKIMDVLDYDLYGMKLPYWTAMCVPRLVSESVMKLSYNFSNQSCGRKLPLPSENKVSSFEQCQSFIC